MRSIWFSDAHLDWVREGDVMTTPEQVKVGDVFRYHPVVGEPACMPVRVLVAPYQLLDGAWICKAEDLWSGRTVYPWLEALSIGETRYGPL